LPRGDDRVRRVLVEQRGVEAGRDALRELRAQGRHRAPQDAADVRDRQGQALFIAREQGAVQVGRGVAQEGVKGAASHDSGRNGLEDGPGAHQVGFGTEDDVVGDSGGDLVAHRGVFERRCRAIGELIGVEERVLRVSDDRRGEQEAGGKG